MVRAFGLDAGPWSGEYLVADTGGAIKGRKIDIWTPSTREALQFGRRNVKLTVLSVAGQTRQDESDSRARGDAASGNGSNCEAAEVKRSTHSTNSQNSVE